MGIKNLNNFVRTECPDAIKTVTFADLAGKVVVVDASIYMYKFTADQALLENMYNLMTRFQMHGIVPIFIFDGKPPDEKRHVLNRRTRLKRLAEAHYNQVKLSLDTSCCRRTSQDEHRLKVLKRRFIRLHDDDFERVKTLMHALGVNYIVAPGEADAMCAQMVLKHKAYACMSDDTDMFVYGCPRVLRHLNLLDETMTMCSMNQILNVLGINMTEFRQICVVSGTDYACNKCNNHNNNNNNNPHVKPFNLHLKLVLQLFRQHKKCIQEAAETNDIVATDFYTWLHHNCSTLYPNSRFDYDEITGITDMFDVTHVKLPMSLISSAHRMKRDCELLYQVMAHENFIFVKAFEI
jgi:hypothetical protein